ncbi:MAG: hypothetical protein J7M25_15450 [Deltaproteobacteria bacterium]|nr:hypothetical protein [Deltaproteobacteria bacterium]
MQNGTWIPRLDRSRRSSSPTAGRILTTSLGLLAMTVAFGGCPHGGKGVIAARRQAGPWHQSYAVYFDDELDHRYLVAFESDEPFVQKSMEHLKGRIRLSDTVAVGTVTNVADMVRSDGATRRGAVVQVEKMLKGAKATLPDQERISLFMSEDQPQFAADEVVGKKVVVFLRWLPGSGIVAFHWHANLANDRILTIIGASLKRLKH